MTKTRKIIGLGLIALAVVVACEPDTTARCMKCGEDTGSWTELFTGEQGRQDWRPFPVDLIEAPQRVVAERPFAAILGARCFGCKVVASTCRVFVDEGNHRVRLTPYRDTIAECQQLNLCFDMFVGCMVPGLTPGQWTIESDFSSPDPDTGELPIAVVEVDPI